MCLLHLASTTKNDTWNCIFRNANDPGIIFSPLYQPYMKKYFGGGRMQTQTL